MNKRITMLLVLLVAVALGALYIKRFHMPKSVSPVRGEFISIEDQSLYLTDQGEGQVVVFLSSQLIHSDTWFTIASNPPAGYRYITIDWPGAGYSQKTDATTANPSDLSMMLKLVLDKMRIDQAILVGHELGGGVAMVCAARYPNLVKGLFLIAPDCSFGQASSILGPWWEWPVINIVVATVRLDRHFVRSYLKKAWGSHDEQWGDLVEKYYLPLSFKNARYHFLKNHSDQINFHYLPYEERVMASTVIAWGGKDTINPRQNGMSLAQSLNRAEFIELPDTGHLPQEEDSDKIISLMRDFFESLSHSRLKIKVD